MGRYHDGKDLDTSSYPLVAVCIDKDKNSQNALKWAIDTLVQKGQIIVLVHVNTKGTSGGVEDASGFKQPTDPHLRDLFLPFRCFCTRKDIQCKDVLLDDHDVAKSITEFSALAAIEKLVVGATARGGFRFKADIPTTISKGAPDFCTVYVINKGKVSSVRNSIRQAPRVSPLRGHEHAETPRVDNYIRSPFSRGPTGGATRKSYADLSHLSMPDSADISFVSSGRRSVDHHPVPARLSAASADSYDHSFEMSRTPSKWGGDSFGANDHTSFSQSSASSFCSLGMVS
ncbi:hypothetical protein E2562_011837 [Oryza meyeriana var. granulata]|uniref:RING-type E3 ubiquitin transferase n=1 Tax=Oryza meyeriana var. granulata TaxID=110450 RepID=A0A6G1CPM3_9ORYZ|nr:hypothetical protein E2562_011837 [Oryza meyeriana var. granulata]